MRTSTSWKQGVSGNPKGRPPKERTLTAEIESLLEMPWSMCEEYLVARSDDKLKAVLAKTILRTALKENADGTRERKTLWAYLEGQPPQTMKIQTGDDIPEIHIVFDGPGIAVKQEKVSENERTTETEQRAPHEGDPENGGTPAADPGEGEAFKSAEERLLERIKARSEKTGNGTGAHDSDVS